MTCFTIKTIAGRSDMELSVNLAQQINLLFATPADATNQDLAICACVPDNFRENVEEYDTAHLTTFWTDLEARLQRLNSLTFCSNIGTNAFYNASTGAGIDFNVRNGVNYLKNIILNGKVAIGAFQSANFSNDGVGASPGLECLKIGSSAVLEGLEDAATHQGVFKGAAFVISVAETQICVDVGAYMHQRTFDQTVTCAACTCPGDCPVFNGTSGFQTCSTTAIPITAFSVAFSHVDQFYIAVSQYTTFYCTDSSITTCCSRFIPCDCDCCKKERKSLRGGCCNITL